MALSRETVQPTRSPLLLRPHEAAKLLAVCLKTLQNYTDRTGTDPEKIPSIRIGRAVRYSPVALEKWIDERRSGETKTSAETSISAE